MQKNNISLSHLRTAFAALLLLAVGCSHGPEPTTAIQSEANLAGHKVAINSGSIYEIMYSSRPDLTTLCFNTQTDCIGALVGGQADVYVDDDCLLSIDEQRRLGIRMSFRGDEEFPCGFIFRQEPSGVYDSLNHFIDSLLATGELQQIYNRWFNSEAPASEPMPDLGPAPKGKPIRVGEAINMPPVGFPVGKEWRGLEPELLARFGQYVGRPVEFEFYPSNALIPALQSGNFDIGGGGIFVTDERQKTVYFSSCHFSAHPGFYVKDDKTATQVGFFQQMKQLVENNLIVENRWRYITDGLWETVKISVLSIILGTLLGAVVCWMRMSRRRVLSTTAKVYVELMQGIPMLVFLLIMFYVVLSGTGLSATAVAIVAFALNFAAYVSEMFRSAVESVNKGQTEAGLALGFTRWQTFFYIVFPQALRQVLPLYKGEAVSLVKNTSIVGYIAIHDLTRASDMIRNRTFDAFFPLLIVTVIYFVLAWLIGRLLDLTVKKPHKK